MIITEKVIIEVSKSHNFYENKGYKIPKEYDNKKKKMIVHHGTKIEVLVKDLQPNSIALIKSKCDICGKEREQKFYRYRAICNNCMINKVQIGENHPSWKHGKCRQKKCIGCGKKIQWSSIRCSECREKYLIQFRIQNYCIDCGKKVSKKATRCCSCTNKGIHNPCYNKNLTNEERRIKRTLVGLGKWIKEVKSKDNHTCQCCGYVGKIYDGVLQAHHIFNFKDNKDLRLDIKNGITFCQKCHIEFHLKFGKRNNNEKQLKEFICQI